jgi:hypothetical protein
MKEISILNASLMSGPPQNGFTKAMQEVFTGGYWALNPGHKDFNRDLLAIASECKPDIIFLQVQTEGVLDLRVIKELSEHSWTMQWSGDIRIECPPKHYLDVASMIDMTTFSNMKDVHGTRQAGYTSEWLEIGFDPERYRTWENPLRSPAIVAHFNDYGNQFPLSGYRRQIVDKLKMVFGPIDFGVFGNFPGAIGNFNNDQVMESRNYAGAQIAINCSNFFCERYSSDRLQRIMGTGGAVCLSHHFPDIGYMYQVGKHLDTFNTLDALVAKCKYYLNRPEIAKQMAKDGQEHALKNFTFKNMAENIKRIYLQDTQ